MRFVLAFICPPLAILLCGKPFQAIICIPLSFLYFPAVLWALLVVSSHKAELRNRALMRNADKNAKAQIKAIDRQTRELNRLLLEQQEAQAIKVHTTQQPQPRQLPPGSRPLPASVPAQQAGSTGTSQEPALVEEPWLSADRVRGLVERAKLGAIQARDGAVFAYQSLPEWAQPITWGLAAATPVSIVMLIFFLSRG
jgi:uncharacterized membrane protein YqaE (UPF0057 family)